MKKVLTSKMLLSHFDTNFKIVVASRASESGIGAVIYKSMKMIA